MELEYEQHRAQVHFSITGLSMFEYCPCVHLLLGSVAQVVQILFFGSFLIEKSFSPIRRRIESLKLKSLPGIGKAAGITLCLAGVMTIAFYKGLHISPLYHLHGHRDHNESSADRASAPSMATWIKGSLFVIISNLTWSMWLVLQVYHNRQNKI